MPQHNRRLTKQKPLVLIVGSRAQTETIHKFCRRADFNVDLISNKALAKKDSIPEKYDVILIPTVRSAKGTLFAGIVV